MVPPSRHSCACVNALNAVQCVRLDCAAYRATGLRRNMEGDGEREREGEREKDSPHRQVVG
jgi:hypothetical protein